MSNFTLAIGAMILNNTTAVAEIVDSVSGNPVMSLASLALKGLPVAASMYAAYKAVQSVREYTVESPKAPLMIEGPKEQQQHIENLQEPEVDDGTASFVSADDFQDAREDEVKEQEIEDLKNENLEVEEHKAKEENHLEGAFKEMGEAYRASQASKTSEPLVQPKPLAPQIIFARAPLIYTQVPAGYVVQTMVTAIGLVYVYRPVVTRPFATTLRSADKVALRTTYAPSIYCGAPIISRVVPLRMQTV